jgi:hypothetical protein
MTRRKSKREIERALEDFGAPSTDAPYTGIVHEDPETGEWSDPDGNHVERMAADPVMILRPRS